MLAKGTGRGRSQMPVPRMAASTSGRSVARPPSWPRSGSRLSTFLEYPELGMEAVWRIEVEGFPALIVVDDKGNYAQFIR